MRQPGERVERHSEAGRKRPSHRELQFDKYPLLVFWEMTQACSLACLHCRNGVARERAPNELTTEEGKRLLESIHQMGTPLVVLTGGDPALRSDLVELVSYGNRLGLLVAVSPSGTVALSQTLLEELKEAGLRRVAIAIDGPEAYSHDAFRGMPGSFNESLRILQQARALGIETQVHTTLHANNAKKLRSIANVVHITHAVLWNVFPVMPSDRTPSSLLLDAQSLERALGQLAELAETLPFDVTTTGAPQYRRVVMERTNKQSPSGIACEIDENGLIGGMRGITDGVGIAYVSHCGDIYPSGFLPLKTGNVRENELADCYRSHPLFTQLRNHQELQGECGSCPFKRVCGGSRGRAYALRGHPMAEDPHCAYTPKLPVIQSA